VLTILNLNGNNVGPVGAVALVEENSSLAVLGLGRNYLGDYGTTAIADALTRNATLSCLDLHHNNISDVGAAALFRVLTEYKNCALLSVRLEGNPSISPALLQAIDFVLASRAALHSLSKNLSNPLEEKFIQRAIQGKNQLALSNEKHGHTQCCMTGASAIFYLVKGAAVNDPKVIKMTSTSRKCV
jgi:Leucine Rich repeat